MLKKGGNVETIIIYVCSVSQVSKNLMSQMLSCYSPSVGDCKQQTIRCLTKTPPEVQPEERHLLGCLKEPPQDECLSSGVVVNGPVVSDGPSTPQVPQDNFTSSEDLMKDAGSSFKNDDDDMDLEKYRLSSREIEIIPKDLTIEWVPVSAKIDGPSLIYRNTSAMNNNNSIASDRSRNRFPLRGDTNIESSCVGAILSPDVRWRDNTEKHSSYVKRMIERALEEMTSPEDKERLIEDIMFFLKSSQQNLIVRRTNRREVSQFIVIHRIQPFNQSHTHKLSVQ